ncbi:hypothetical protein DLAC_11709 [Tieghemostelium lacteum]|uniref:Uncharacterized protein n=1 Tax=Tieghemostelium lacteum TaxID=361077 RepID=A0A151ZB45_TIELA|nr:hypothetical protein DLAC_11709 [Tieghemostelium lacteum]|eukprot:KYQ91167.1 hypothetical protein DLAC_11709 [Tieghemostelium lacteum]
MGLCWLMDPNYKNIENKNGDSGSVLVYGNYNSDKNLVVERIYKYLPVDFKASTESKFYQFSLTKYTCLRPPCPIYTGYELNTNKSVALMNITSNYDGIYFDTNWFQARIIDREEHRLISRGYSDKRSNFQIENAFVHLPDPYTSCTKIEHQNCNKNQTETFTRDSNRCYKSEGCFPKITCNQLTPHCENGYTLVNWTKTDGCLNFVCDFMLLDTTK